MNLRAKYLVRSAVLTTLLLSIFTPAAGDDAAPQAKDCVAHTPQFIFSWPIGDHCNDSPRGGTSKGAPVTLDAGPGAQWLALREPGLSKFERDRRAILAMAGGYKVTFDFLETVGYSEDFERDKPYQSWGTEYVYVVEDTGSFISLQHLMVMVFVDQDGKASEPMVMKHWRQDWQYQDTRMLLFEQPGHWRRSSLQPDTVQGTWSQSVYQVDDSPRYAAIGTWSHNGSFSTWLSGSTRRPLPRREFSVRNDYQVLEGFNRHTVTRNGWVQEEENWKLIIDRHGEPAADTPYLAKEEGIGRYQRIKGFDFRAGDDYMKVAGQFWADVRRAWQTIIDANPAIELRNQVDGLPLYAPLFTFAEQVQEQGSYDRAAGQAFIDETLARYLLATAQSGPLDSTP